MTIILAENLKKLRRGRDLTQEELAKFLGVTAQAVSKWERSEGYPDITMLPAIANFFAVTVDDLLGNDLISKEEKIAQYYRQFYSAITIEEGVATAKKAYAEYPYSWSIIEIYILSLTHRLSKIPDADTVQELRRLCEFVMGKCTDATLRKIAVYTMIFVEDDENVERWFTEAPDNGDYLESERREERYQQREQWDLYYPQKQQNMLDLVFTLVEKMGYYQDDSRPEWQVKARRKRMELLDTLFQGRDRALLSGKYGGCLRELAMALDETGETEEAIAVLTKSFDIHEEHQKLGQSLATCRDAKISFSDPLWDRLAFPAFPGKFPTKILDKLAKKPAYAQNEDFRKLLERIRAANSACTVQS